MNIVCPALTEAIVSMVGCNMEVVASVLKYDDRTCRMGDSEAAAEREASIELRNVLPSLGFMEKGWALGKRDMEVTGAGQL